MKKHLELRFGNTNQELEKKMLELANKLEVPHEQIIELAEQSRQISELDYLISKIDAIQAELWRRLQK